MKNIKALIAEKGSSVVEWFAQNWIWIAIGVSALVLVLLIFVFVFACKVRVHKNKEEVKPEQPVKVEPEITESDNKPDLEMPLKKPEESVECEKPKPEEVVNNNYEKDESLKFIDLLLAELMYERQLNHDMLLNLISNNKQDTNTDKEQFDNKEKIVTDSNQVSGLKELYNQLNSRLDKIENLFNEQKEEQLQREKDSKKESELRAMCRELNQRLDENEALLKKHKEENSNKQNDKVQESQLIAIYKELDERLDKTEALLSKQVEEKSNKDNGGVQESQLIALYKALDERLDRTEALLNEQKEENLKKEIENQQKQLDETKQNMLAEKIADKLDLQEKINALENMLNKAILDNQNNLPNVENNTYVKQEPENNKTLDFDEDLDIDLISDDAVVIEGVKKLTLQEAYEELSDKQKIYFDMIKNYASTKPDARIKETKSYISVGVGNKNYVQLTIKKNIVVACFTIESEELLQLRLNGKTSIKPEKTKIKIVDVDSFEEAKRMIDIRETQVAREIEITKELRKEKQKQRYEDSKKN